MIEIDCWLFAAAMNKRNPIHRLLKFHFMTLIALFKYWYMSMNLIPSLSLDIFPVFELCMRDACNLFNIRYTKSAWHWFFRWRFHLSSVWMTIAQERCLFHFIHHHPFNHSNVIENCFTRWINNNKTEQQPNKNCLLHSIEKLSQ